MSSGCLRWLEITEWVIVSIFQNGLNMAEGAVPSWKKSRQLGSKKFGKILSLINGQSITVINVPILAFILVFSFASKGGWPLF